MRGNLLPADKLIEIYEERMKTPEQTFKGREELAQHREGNEQEEEGAELEFTLALALMIGESAREDEAYGAVGGEKGDRD